MDISSGVPQGSVLGPVLFLVFVNNLPDSVLSNLHKFADDTKLYCSIKFIEICDIDPYNVIDWGRIWLTNFDSSKCT